MQIDNLLAIVPIIVTIAVATVPWLFQVHTKLAVIAQKMETLVQFTNDCKANNQLLDERLDLVEQQIKLHQQILDTITKQ
jgi:hypothetical protein